MNIYLRSVSSHEIQGVYLKIYQIIILYDSRARFCLSVQISDVTKEL